MVWNVRGFNTAEKQHKVAEAIRAHRVDVAMLTETRLKHLFEADSMHVVQTSFDRKGGCVTAVAMDSHRIVKQLGTYLN